MTPAQLATLKADIAADGILGALTHTTDNAIAIAAAYNLAASPAFWVWRTRVSKDELVGSTSVDGTTFSWTGTGFITRAQGERDAFRELFDASGNCNPSLPNVRAAFSDIFSGTTAPAPANRTHLATVARRVATRIERVFATGTGSTASPGLMTFEGAISLQDVQDAWSA